jgi:hypothetical protein
MESDPLSALRDEFNLAISYLESSLNGFGKPGPLLIFDDKPINQERDCILSLHSLPLPSVSSRNDWRESLPAGRQGDR